MINVGSDHYVGLNGFGGGGYSPGEMEAIQKALTAGQDINAPSATPGQGFPLRVESLEATLKNLTFMMEHIRLWKNIPKIPAFNTVEEYNELSSYGVNDNGFIGEMELPETDDSTYARRYVVMKYMGVVRKVSHVASIVKPAHGNIIANETVNGTMKLLSMIERALFNGDSSLSDLQFDGFRRMIEQRSPASNIVDLRGRPLDEDVLQDISLIVSDGPNFGIPTHFHINPRAKVDVIKSIFPKGRYDVLQKPDSGMIGLDTKGFISPAGDVQFEPNTFIDDGGSPSAAAGDSTKRPGAPTISTAATSPVDAASKFTAADADSYFYRIVAYNDYGHSDPVDVSAGPAAIAVAAGDKVTFGVTKAGGNATKWYQLYRTKVGYTGAGTSNADYRLIARFAASSSPMTVEDFNENLPFTTVGFLFQQNLNALSFKQLAPMLKIPLATIDISIRWAQVLYGAPTLYAPGKVLMVKNIGRSTNSIVYP